MIVRLNYLLYFYTIILRSFFYFLPQFRYFFNLLRKRKMLHNFISISCNYNELQKLKPTEPTEKLFILTYK